jgi:phosphosulfolactate phosphohydrolase-like enzyme
MAVAVMPAGNIGKGQLCIEDDGCAGAIAAALVAHGEDASDANLPLMIWYGIEPLGLADPAALATMAIMRRRVRL